jgi:endonuclease-3
MSTSKSQQPNRQQLVAKLHKALKSSYKQVTPNTARPVLEQVLYACCLENASYEAAEKALAKLLQGYFDLNEVRVTTVAELAEHMADLPDPPHAALGLRRVLQGVFESSYSFSLENAKKHSIAHGIKTLEHLHGIPPFAVHFVASTALGGHFIPIDRGALSALYLTGIVSEDEYNAEKAAGLERFVTKKAGPEFSSLLHQFGVEVLGNLHGTTVKKVLQAVNPAAKDRFPKRGEPLPIPSPPPPATGKQGQRAAEAARTAAEEHRPAGPQAAARPAGKTPLPPPGSGPKRTADGKPIPGSKPGPKPFVVKPNAGKPITIKPQGEPPAAKVEERKTVEPKKPLAKPVAKPVAKSAKPVAKPGAAAKGSAAKPVVGKPSSGKPSSGKPVAKGGGAKPAARGADGSRHSAQLARRKPR